MTTDKTAYATAFLAGTILWSLATLATARREVWDAGLYWTIAYPAALLTGAGLAMLFPHRPWRWPLVVMLAQMPVMIAMGSGFGLFPLGLALLAILSLPGMAIAAVIGAWRRANTSP
jgi:hypothetical protein